MSFYSTLYNIHIANNFLLSIISYTYGYLRSNSLINGKFLNQSTLQGGNHMTAISKPVNKQKKHMPDHAGVAAPSIYTNADGTISVSTHGSVITEEEPPVHKSFLKEPGSAITHLIGILLSVAGAVPILYKASGSGTHLPVIATAVFISSMALLYLASTLYHSIYASETITCILQKFDHIMIYFLIAGTYTPICLLALPKPSGIPLLILIWSLTVCGFILTVFWINSPKWLNSTIYILMGWLCIFAFKPLFTAISSTAFAWLFAGGVIYTIGGIIYALKLPVFNNLHKNFGSHEIFHLFVLGGSICHYYMIYTYLL